ncbi:TcpQ domain-containing protein [Ferrimonas marina]|uniref:TcpQ domain-containing protein n=1 Tax=Ferrimonas marina TaxID=299255 RepID=UPI0013563F66|nr:TcpQ domain-containing protein [Ferrimonas marina]
MSPEVPGAVVGSDYLMVSQERAFQAVKTFGRDVPLELALGSIVPNRDQWTVHFDGELASKRVSWKGGNTWQEVIDEIEHREGIFIHVNPLERAIGVAEKAKDAKHFAHREPKVWDITGGTELRKVIANWADRAGWRVAWDASYEMEFTIAFDTRFYGDFEGEDGVLARLLASVSRNNDPLSARMHLGNDVIYIHQGGHRQSVQY